MRDHAPGAVPAPAIAPPASLAIVGSLYPGYARILSPAALDFVADLTARFAAPLRELLDARAARQAEFDRGAKPAFLPSTAAVRRGEWKVAPAPKDLERRVVEITGPVDRKMIINALNSGADCFMADLEDSNSPTWSNVVEGQIHLADAVRRTISVDDAAKGKTYRLAEKTATLIVRPRGLHLVERHAQLAGKPVPAALFDFGLFLFHNAAELIARGSGPYFYLPKMESHREARWWSQVFARAEAALGLPRGTIRATVLIETLPAAFEMDEILFELKENIVGLNCGRWDYIFSFIKVHRAHRDAILPDRAQVTMEQPFLRAYTQLLVKTCHRRGAHAIGGMAAQIPIKDDPEADAAAMAKVKADKTREARDGHDGTWVAHPGLVAAARDAFAAQMAQTKGAPNQLQRMREDVSVDAVDLLALPSGTRTEKGLRHNVRVGVLYLEAWLRGQGCVPLFHLMEDAATAEICRAQIWQWLRHGATLDDGSRVDVRRLVAILGEELRAIAGEKGGAAFERGRFDDARELFEQLCFAPEMPAFLTHSAYERLS